ncbi:F-box protein, partial [Mucuna pruriens]
MEWLSLMPQRRGAERNPGRRVFHGYNSETQFCSQKPPTNIDATTVDIFRHFSIFFGELCFWPAPLKFQFKASTFQRSSRYLLFRYHSLGVGHPISLFEINYYGVVNISDQGVQLVADNYPELESLNLTRCVKITDDGLKSLLHKCLFLQSLNLYALSSFTDEAYRKICLLARLKFLDLCGAQNLSDEGLSCISKCKNLLSLNLTWCVRVTDEGVISIAEGCTSLEFLSLFGIIGVTDKCLEALSKSCSTKITTLDKRSREELLQLFPYLKCFKVHS